MAVAAQAGEVIGGLVLRVTIGAGRKTSVIEVGRFPRVRGVARAALAGEVIDGRIHLMALLTRRCILMIKLGGLESDIRVAALAGQTHRLKLALVLVLVAADTRRRQALGLPADVALIAVDLRMPAGKRGAMLGRQFRRQRNRTRRDLDPAR